MGITSLQVCMDSSDWLHQGTISDENTGMESSPITPTSDQEDILTCSRPLIERRIRPQHEQALKCPRCESTHTKFCYYNNYSLSQPRYFCKTCRRYWTKGGTLRNIPVGGGCRKNKKVSSNSKKSLSNDLNPSPPSLLNQQNYSTTGLSPSPLSSNHNYNHFNNNNNSTELQLAFPDQIHFSSLHSSGIFNTNPNLHSFLLENPTPIDFMENKYETLVGNHDFMGNGENFGGINNGGLVHNNFHGICSSFDQMSSSLDYHHHGINSSAAGTILESCQRLMVPYENHEVDVKPNPSKILSLEWHDHQQACNSDAGISYLGGIGSWTGLMNAYGSSNPLV